MKKLFTCLLVSSCLCATANAASTVQEGVVKSSEVITGEVGRDGRPVLAAGVGVAIGSTIGSGSGNDAAKVAGGLIGAKRAMNKKKQTVYGWRYVVEVAGELAVVDTWCDKPDVKCSSVNKESPVYVVNNSEVIVKAE
ncbi:hypothetical protein E2K93_10635 [Thalassotalea sp. HSM 43]|uniref:hypothetical protein n=1 Tax=Thalassotalea sp. HSM 43 TaxID=2552945 RepID=UPI0010808F60|nr:hypothetical protein [Thalassotalea sp. HSM 43]QBY04811.1 hypothetical protein E2K93_10635 [Thalassotalea sp. HSM 43]